MDLRAPSTLVPTGVTGALAFAIGYVVLYVLKGTEIMQNFLLGFRATGGNVAQLQAVGITLPEQWQVVGLVYHSTHNVPYTVTVSSGFRQQSMTVGRGFLSGELLPWLIPIVVLFAAGFVAARLLRPSVPARGGIVGAAIAPGYALVALGSTVVFTWSASAMQSGVGRSLSIGPALASTLVFTCVGYPVLFGGLGGAVAVWLRSSGY